MFWYDFECSHSEWNWKIFLFSCNERWIWKCLCVILKIVFIRNLDGIYICSSEINWCKLYNLQLLSVAIKVFHLKIKYTYAELIDIVDFVKNMWSITYNCKSGLQTWNRGEVIICSLHNIMNGRVAVLLHAVNQ